MTNISFKCFIDKIIKEQICFFFWGTQNDAQVKDYIKSIKHQNEIDTKSSSKMMKSMALKIELQIFFQGTTSSLPYNATHTKGTLED